MIPTNTNHHHDFTLSPQQEELFFAALNSNKASNKMDLANKSLPPSTNSLPNMASTSTFNESPLQPPASASASASASNILNAFEESPFIDYDYDFDGDDTLNFHLHDSQGQMIGNLAGTSSDGDVDNHEKRSHPDDGDEEEGGGKRREGDDKSSKKPGRKPLTSEPTSKRKAQNRAAQRAFRERKEKHLKDLETKVEDLEKASESANHENSILRAQIERMSMELREYKKRVSINGIIDRSSNGNVPAYFAGKALSNVPTNPNDVNFQFEFPRFGHLPAPPIANGSLPIGSSISPTTQHTQSPTDKSQTSSRNQSNASNNFGIGLAQNPAQIGRDMSSFNSLFAPETSYEHFGNGANGSISNTNSPNISTGGQNTSYSSPSASSHSINGASSSCGTSPESTNMQSPYNKAVDSTLTTIGEENACGNNNNAVTGNDETALFNINGIDWFAQQNNNQFDPQLFGDYREPQNNILSNDPYALDDGFFADVFDLQDFSSPFNVPTPTATKKDLVQQIDEKQNEDDEVVPAQDRSTMLSCNTIWDRLQKCPKVKKGDFDLDKLCKDLQKKAKCSETGTVVNESDFQNIMKNYVPEACNSSTSTAKKV